MKASSSAAEVELPPTLYGQVINTSVGFVKVLLYDPGTTLAQDGRLVLQPQQNQGETPAMTAAAAESEAPSTSGQHRGLQEQSAQRWRALPRRQLLCNVRSLLRKLSKRVLAGDHVVVGTLDWKEGRGSVLDVLPRYSELVDPAIANVDHALLVFALDQPPFEELQVSKFLVSMEASGLPFTLVLNKVDLVPEDERQRRAQQVRAWGYEPLLVSCNSGEGLEQVSKALSGRTSVMAGPSGAGKSSLINALRLGRHRPDQELLLGPAASCTPEGPADADEQPCAGSSPSLPELAVASAGNTFAGEPEPEFLVVGEMSRAGRGMHTTTSVTLIRLPEGGMLADTPGFSQPSLSQVGSQELATLFPEMRAVMEQQPCRFSNCIHLMEPGCSINNSSQAMERYPLYVKMLGDIKTREDTDVKVLQQAKQQRESSGKVKTGKGGKQRVEAKLDTRKHRSGSRQKARLGVLDSLDS